MKTNRQEQKKSAKGLKPSYSRTVAARKARMVMLDRETRAKPLGDRPVVIGDIRDTQERQGLGLLELYFLFANTPRELPLSPQYSNVRLDSVTKRTQMALMIRFFTECEEANFLPQKPDLDEVYALLEEVLVREMPEMDPKSVNWAKLSILAGTTDWSGRWWKGGSKRSPMVDRFFMSILAARHKRGDKTVVSILRKILNQEARARGFAGGLPDVIRNRGWNKRPKKTVAVLEGKGKDKDKRKGKATRKTRAA